MPEFTAATDTEFASYLITMLENPCDPLATPMECEKNKRFYLQLAKDLMVGEKLTDNAARAELAKAINSFEAEPPEELQAA